MKIILQVALLSVGVISLVARPTKHDLNMLTDYQSTSTYTEDSPLFYGLHTENFVNRWGYQGYCRHWYDIQNAWATVSGGVELIPEEVEPGDIVFVRKASRFFQRVHPKITCPYIMVTAGEFYDRVQEEYLSYLDDDKIIAWFSIHPCEKSHPKLHHIPLGILQKKEFYDDRKALNDYFKQLRNTEKEHMVYLNFTGGHTPPFKADREYVYSLFINKPYCIKGKKRDFRSYLSDMAKAKFALSPSGTAPDTYRTWEALLVGTIPIVKTSQLDALYSDLPILIVNEWEDVTEELLEQTWEEFTTKKFTIDKLFLDYWWNKIEKVREEFLRSYD